MKHFKKARGKKGQFDAKELEQLSREELRAIIDEQIDLPWRKIDYELLRVCYALLGGPESENERAQRAKQAEASLQTLRQRIRQREEERKKQWGFGGMKGWRAAIAVMSVLLVLFVPVISRRMHRSFVSPDGQDYVVMGIRQNAHGAAQADVSGRPEDEDYVLLQNQDEIPAHFGYAIDLPAWLPEGITVEEIAALRTAGMDTLDIVYGHQGNQVRVTFMYDRDIMETVSYYEQDGKGSTVKLHNGADIYVSNNIQSIWGLYQEEKVSYYISLIGYDENTLIRIFDSI